MREGHHEQLPRKQHFWLFSLVGLGCHCLFGGGVYLLCIIEFPLVIIVKNIFLTNLYQTQMEASLKCIYNDLKNVQSNFTPSFVEWSFVIASNFSLL